MVTENWVLSVWDAMKNVVTMILIKPFQILDSIPLGYLDASVMDFILGIGIIGIAIFFFWRSATGEAVATAGVTMRRDRANREKFAEKSYISRSASGRVRVQHFRRIE